MTTATTTATLGIENGNFPDALTRLHSALDSLKEMTGEDWDEAQDWEKGCLLTVMSENRVRVDVNDIANWIVKHHPEYDPDPDATETTPEYWHSMGSYLHDHADGDEVLELIASYWEHTTYNDLAMRSTVIDRYIKEI